MRVPPGLPQPIQRRFWLSLAGKILGIVGHHCVEQLQIEDVSQVFSAWVPGGFQRFPWG